MNLKRYLCFFLVIAMMLITVLPAAAAEPESAPVIIEGDSEEIIIDETPDEPSEEPSEEPTEEITDEITDETSDETEEEPSEEPTEEPSEEPTEGGENEIAPVAEESVAKVGEAQYNTLAAAIEVAKSGDTITLLADVTEDVTVSKSVTIDGANKTYTGKMTLTADTTIKNVNFDGKGYNGYAVETRGADYLTIEDCTAKNYGYGFVQLASGTALTTVKNVTVSNMNYGVKVDYSNAVVLENVKLDCAVAGVLNSNYGEKTITIKDSDISILGTWTRNNTTKTKVVFEGTNSIDKFIIDAAIDTFVLAKDATLTAPNEITLTTEDGNIVYANGSYAVVEKTYAAQVGEEKYETLAEAVVAANEAGDATIVLLSDVTLGEKLTFSGNVTISGDVTITRDDAYTGTLFSVNAGAALTLDGGLTIDGGNNYSFNSVAYKADLEAMLQVVKADSAKWFTPEEGAPVAAAYMITTTGGTVNLNDVTIQNNYSTNSGVVSVGANSTVNLTGAKITHCANITNSGLAVNASGAGIQVNMNDGTVIDGNHVGGNHGIFKIYSGAVLTMNGGEVKNTTGWNSNGTVVGLYGGTFIMNGGTICSNSSVYGDSNGRNAAIYLHSNSTMEMHGGTICHNTGRSRGGIDSSKATSKLTITGGAVLDNISVAGNSTADIGGTTGTWAISGGTFTQDVSKWLTPDTGLVYNEETGKYNTTDHIYNLYFRDPVTGEQLPYVGPLQGNDMASLVATGKSFYANYYKMELEVLSNAKIDKTVVIDYPMTINLNGKTISATSDVDPVFRVEADVTVTGNGKIDARNGVAYAFILGKTDGTEGNLTINNGTFMAETTVASVTNGTLTINGGNFAVNPYVVEGQEDNYNFLLNCIDANYKAGTAKIVVNGGVFFKFDPSNNAAEGAGTNFCADGYIAEELKTNYWTVRAVNYVAQVGEVMYESLKEALEACTNGETVKLIADITYGAEDVVYAHGGATGFGNYDQYNPSIIYIGGTKGATAAENQPSNVNAVLDLNGHSITSTADAYLFLIMDNAKVTFIDNVGDGQVYNQSANYPAIWSVGTETLVTISGGSYFTNSPYGLLHVTHSGDLVITGGSFKTNATDASLLIMLNSQKYNNPNYFLKGVATVSIKGGTFYGFNPEKVGDDYGATSIEDIKFVDGCAENYAPVDNGDGTYGVKYDPSYGNVAKLGDTYYKTLQAAVDACVAGENTITLIADVAENVTVNKSVTIDGADKTYTGTMTVKGNVNVTVQDVNFVKGCIDDPDNAHGYLTVKNCNFDGVDKSIGYAISVRGGDKLTIENSSAKNYSTGMLYIPSAVAEFSIKDVNVENVAAAFNISYSGNGTFEKVTLNNVTYGIHFQIHPGGSRTYTVKDCDLKGATNPFWFWDKSNNTAKVTVVFEGNNDLGTKGITVNAGALKLAAGATLTAAEGLTITTDAEDCEVEYSAGVYSVVDAVRVAQIGDTQYKTLAAAIEAAKSGDTITLLADVAENVTVSKNLTIDGADKTYTGQMTLKADTTIKNVNFDGKGYNGYAVETRGAGYLTIEDCTAKNYGYGFVQLASGTALTTVKNVTVSNCNYGVKVDYSNAVVLENVDLDCAVAGVLNSNYGEKTITIKDSDISILGTWTRNNTTKTTYVFEGENSIGEFIIDAAIDNFKLAADATLTAPEEITVTTDVDGMKVAYEDGTYKLVKAAIAAIGKVQYSSLQAAVDAANAGQTIKLLCDAEGPGVVIDKNLNINFNTFTYTLTEGVGSTGTESNGFQILAGNTVKLMDGGLKVADSAADKFYILIQNYSDLTLNNMLLDGRNLDKWSKTDGDSYVLSNNSGKTTVNSTTKFIVNDDGDKAFAFDVCKFANYSEPTITVKAQNAIYTDEATLATNYKNYIEAVAVISNTYYATLQQAVNKGGTVSLFRDSSGSGVVINNDVNINFGGYTYTLTEGVGSTGTESNGFQILKGNTVVMRNGTVKVAESAADKFYILLQNYADLSTANLTLDGTYLDKWSKTDGDSYVVSNNSGNVSIGSGTTITANDDGDLAFAFDACDKSAWGYELPVVTVHKNATIEGNIEAAAKIGNVYYASLNQAIEAADGKTVTLMKNIDLADEETVTLDGKYNTYFLVDGKTVTINLNGKTISGEYNGESMLVGVFSTDNGGNLTLTGNGTVDVTANSTVYGLVVNYEPGCYTTIENGTFILDKASDSLIYTGGDEDITVKGGTFTLGNVGTGANGSPWIFNAKGQNTASVTVTGGTFNANVALQHWAHEVDIEDGNGNLSYIIDNKNGTWTVSGKPAEVAILTDVAGNYDLALGYATFKDAVASIAKGAPETTIVLQKNITVKGQFIGHSYAQKVIVDLNGYKMSSTDKALTVYRSGTEVLIKNGTVHGNTTGGTIQVTYGGKLTLGENTTITCGGSANALKVDANSTLIIADDSVKVQGGKNDLIVADGAKVEISAGYFKHPVKAEWCAEGYVPCQHEDGTYGVAKDPTIGMVAKIGDNYYATLAAAIAAAEDGDTVTVLKNIGLANVETVLLDNAYNTYFKVEGKSVIVDLNGKVISGTYGDTSTMLVGVFSTDNNGHLTLTGNGTVNVDVAEGATVYSLLANYEEGCTITVKNGSYTLSKAHDCLLYTGGDEGMLVDGGTFFLGNVGEGQNGKPWIFNTLGANDRHAFVTGGSFNADVSNQYWKYEVQFPADRIVVKEGEMYKVIQYVEAMIGETGYTSLAAAIEEAKTGDVITLNMDVAVDTSELVTNSGGYATIYNVAEKAITIDLNDKEINVTVNAADVADANNAMLLGVFAVDTNGSLTLTGNGTVTANAVDGSMTSDESHLYSLMIAYGAGSELVVKNGTYHANSVSSALVYSQYDEIVTIENGTYTLGNLGTDANGSPWLFNAKGQNTANIKVNGGTFCADIQHQHYPFEVMMPKEKALSKDSEGMYTVVDAVAYVTEREWSSNWYTNEVGYATLEEAIAACEGPKTRSGKTSEQEVVVLLTNIVLEGKLVLPENAVLDWNGHTITQNYGTETSNNVVPVTDAATLIEAVANGNSAVLTNPIEVPENTEFLIEASKEIEFNGSGNTITTKGTGTKPGVSFDYGYVGFIPANGEDAVVRDVKVVGSGFVEVGHHGVSTGGNYSITKLVIENLIATLAVNNGGNNIAAAFSHYGNATMTNCVMTGTTTEKEGYKPYDAAFVNGTNTVINQCKFDKVYVANQAHVTITDTEIEEIDSCAITTRDLGMLTIGAGAKIGTINLNPGKYTPAIVIEEGAEVGAIVYNGVTYTVDQWLAR